MGIELVCFDLGGVIVRICRGWAEGCERAGLEVRGASDGEEMRARRRPISLEYHNGLIDCDAFCTAMAEAMGGLYTPKEVRLIHDAWLIDEYAGVGDVIERLVARGIPTGLLSNTNHSHWVRIDPSNGAAPEFPTASKLEHRHASHILGVSKPEPGIYTAFMDSVGYAPGEILFFDDLQDNIEGARSLGWEARRIDHEGDTARQIEDHLRELGLL